VLDALALRQSLRLTHPWQRCLPDFYQFSILVALLLAGYCFLSLSDTIPVGVFVKDFQSSWGLVGAERGCGYITPWHPEFRCAQRTISLPTILLAIGSE
jgi:hypothetical protein